MSSSTSRVLEESFFFFFSRIGNAMSQKSITPFTRRDRRTKSVTVAAAAAGTNKTFFSSQRLKKRGKKGRNKQMEKKSRKTPH